LSKQHNTNRRMFLKKLLFFPLFLTILPKSSYANSKLDLSLNLDDSLKTISSSNNISMQNDIFGVSQSQTNSGIVDEVDSNESRSLQLYNTHTQEKLDVVYYENGNYLDYALDEINSIMADHRTHEKIKMNKDLIDLLYDIKGKLSFHDNKDSFINIISAYRSPVSNSKLRRRSRRVAKNSFHMKGEAIDINISGVKLSSLRREAKKIQKGGVGYYPRSNFVHIDIGDVRSWRG